MSDQGYQPQPLRNAVAGHVGGGTPSRQVPSYWRGKIPWASVKDFPEQSGVIHDTEEHISASGLNASASNLISAGTPLVCTRMAVGRAAMPSVPMAINQDVKAIFPAPGVSPAYLLKLLQFIQPKAEAQAVGSTVKGIRIQDYLDIKTPIADTDAQPFIACILDTLDTAIHETEAIIAKLRAVKQGLLHDLLTRGIDANGELARIEFAPIISGSNNDDPAWKTWTDGAAHEQLIKRFKKPLFHAKPEKTDPLAFLVVKSMLLTGFDAPIEGVMYLDRPIREAELLQAIARVNRTGFGKRCGIVVDYFGVAQHLKEALAAYADEDVEGALASLKDEATFLKRWVKSGTR
jgi:hypothetical protein